MKNIFYFLTLGLLFFTGCKNGSKEQGRILSRSEFVSFLADLHFYDAYFIKEKLFDAKLANNDSLSYYNSLLKKYGINYSDFDRTLRYYFNSTERFNNLYELVQDTLKARYDYYDSLRYAESDKRNLWPYEREYKVPDGKTEETELFFEFSALGQGRYILSEDVKIYPDDKTQRLQLMLKIKYTDNSEDSAYQMIYKRDGKFHTYSVSLVTNSRKEPEMLKCYLLKHQNDAIIMHVDVKKITLVKEETNQASSQK